MKIPFSKPSITEEEIAEVTKVLNSGWLTVGPKVKEFEQALLNYTKARYVTAVDSCTSALTLALVAISRCNEYDGKPIALIPALTFVATANAAYHAGYEVKFTDVGEDGNMLLFGKTPAQFDVAIPVHFAGQVCNLSTIRYSSNVVLEDAAHAIGATYDGFHLGTSEFSDGACFSFYPTKNMTTIEGGAFITYRSDLADTVRTLSLHGLGSAHLDRFNRSSISKPVVYTNPGYKANMTDVEAAIGIVQLRRLNFFIEKRKRIAKIYKEELKNYLGFLKENGNDHVWHMCVALVTDDRRDEVVSKLRESEIMVGIHYSPTIPEHPFYKNHTGSKITDYPMAKYISDHCMSLPLYYDITDEEVETVIQKVKAIT